MLHLITQTNSTYAPILRTIATMEYWQERPNFITKDDGVITCNMTHEYIIREQLMFPQEAGTSFSTALQSNCKARLMKLYSTANEDNAKTTDIHDLNTNILSKDVQYWCSRILQLYGGTPTHYPEDIPSLFQMLPSTKTNVPMFPAGQFRKYSNTYMMSINKNIAKTWQCLQYDYNAYANDELSTLNELFMCN